ncbi:glycosyltransferase [Candidatus Peregrinibacteria bacterium]|nr:glycosyltransferase [Candidatus Peregrinibacteria bacterium]
MSNWIPQEKFAELLKRTKIFLYITEFHRAGLFRRLPGEGFGLPALEAVACGAVVGSNLLGGVTDFLTPGENCIKLQNGNLNFDLLQIKNAIENFDANSAGREEAAQQIQTKYSYNNAVKKWKKFLETAID